MKKLLYLLFVVILIILSAFAFFKITALENDINKLTDSIENTDIRLEKSEKNVATLVNSGYVERTDLKSITKNIVPAIVFILGKDFVPPNENNGIFSKTTNTSILGTGFFVSKDGYIATARHVIENLDVNNIQIKDSNNKVHVAKLVALGDTSDVAILKTTGTFTEVELGSFQNIEVGEDIGLIGFNPGFNIPLVHKGSVSAIGNDQSGVKIFTINSFVNKGNSGSPVFSLITGRVIGIVNAKELDLTGRVPLDVNKISSGMSLGGTDPIKLSAQIYNDMLKLVGEVSQVGIGIITSTDEIKKLMK